MMEIDFEKLGALGFALILVFSVVTGSLAFVGGVAAHETGEQTTYHGDVPTINSSSTDVTTVTLSDSETLTGVDVNITSIDGAGNVSVDIVRASDGHSLTSVKLSGVGLHTFNYNDSSYSGDTFEVRLSTDDANTTAEVSHVEFAYSATNYAPVADAGEDKTVVHGDSVTLDASGSFDRDEGDNLTYEWDFGDGETLSGEPTATHTYADAGTYTATLTVTDEHGATDTDTVTITVEESNSAPTADAGANQTAAPGENVTFNASGSSDPNGDALTYSWDFDGDGVEDATGVSPTHAFDTAGDYEVSLTVSDGSLTATDSMFVTVEDSTTTEEPATYDVDFSVVDNDTAVANASIVVTDENGTEVANLTTDADGSAVATLEDGNYSFTIFADGYTDASGDVTVDGAAQSVSVDFSNEDGGVVIIDDGSSDPLANLSAGQIVGGVIVSFIVMLILGLAAKVE